MNELILSHFNGKLLGEVDVPISKSECNRLLILEAISGGKIKLQNNSDANDSLILQRVLDRKSVV